MRMVKRARETRTSAAAVVGLLVINILLATGVESVHRSERRGSLDFSTETRKLSDDELLEFLQGKTTEPETKSILNIDVVGKSQDHSKLQALLESEKCNRIYCYKHMCGGQCPAVALQTIRESPLVTCADESIPPQTAFAGSGSIGEEAPISVLADQARIKYGVNGTGIKVCVISNSFNCSGRYASDVASGELPPDVEIIDDSDCPNNDEGRAMLQIVHDVAPGAKLAFISAGVTLSEFASKIESIPDIGCTIAVDDISVPVETWYQPDIVSQAIDQVVVGAGIPWFTSAGNDARFGYESKFRPVVENGTVYHNFASQEGVVQRKQTFNLTANRFSFEMQWDQPSQTASVNAPRPSRVSASFTFKSSNGVVFTLNPLPGTFDRFGGTPSYLTQSVPPSTVFPSSLFPIGIELSILVAENETLPGRVAWVMTSVPDGGQAYNNIDPPANFGTIYRHFGLESAITVGAADYNQTPAYGTDPAIVEPFSSVGGTFQTLDSEGNFLPMPVIRRKPDIVGTDRIPSTVFVSFIGTSAAAPVAAAVGALVLQKNPHLNPSELKHILQSTALDMDDPLTPNFDKGFDFATGFGLVDANRAVQRAFTIPPTAKASKRSTAFSKAPKFSSRNSKSSKVAQGKDGRSSEAKSPSSRGKIKSPKSNASVLGKNGGDGLYNNLSRFRQPQKHPKNQQHSQKLPSLAASPQKLPKARTEGVVKPSHHLKGMLLF